VRTVRKHLEGPDHGVETLSSFSTRKRTRDFSGEYLLQSIRGDNVAPVASSDKRSLNRLRPRGVVSLAVYQGDRIPPAYGILSDISEGGIRIHSDRILAQGQRLQLRIQFESELDLFEAAGRVAWTRPATGDDSLLGGSLTGIQLSLPSLESAYWLRRLLAAPEFEEPSSQSRDYDDFLASLRPYLERLGDYMAALGLRSKKR